MIARLDAHRPDDPAGMAADGRAGLSRRQKTLPSKYLYDARGSELFDAITELPEYYPTRTETAILGRHAADMAAVAGPHRAVIEFGIGSAAKSQLLLDSLDRPACFVPIDISPEALNRAAEDLRQRFPMLPIMPLVADFTGPVRLPPSLPATGRLAFFPGSTIGNFEPADAASFLSNVARTVGPDGALLIGVDLKKPTDILIPAYDDADGVTAAFNLNLLARLNRELDADFDIAHFSHEARYDADHGRVEMHAVSRRRQTVTVAGTAYRFEDGESIRTECSYKYTLPEFRLLARTAGWHPRATWTDERELFSVHYLSLEDD